MNDLFDRRMNYLLWFQCGMGGFVIGLSSTPLLAKLALCFVWTCASVMLVAACKMIFKGLKD